MTEDENKPRAAVVRATESLFLENIALKLVLEHRVVQTAKATGETPVGQRDAGGCAF